MKKNKKGFTLVELVIVVAVMAVLVAVAIPTVTSITKTAKEAVANTNAKTIESTLKLKEADKNKEGDVVQILTVDDIDSALENAKLGIDAGSTFVYDSNDGTVEPVFADSNGTITVTLTEKQFKIEFAADNAVTVTPYVAPAEGN